ncbi:hypothetical protein EP232_04880 [bacterium]|nr:MAG: hypothetical protein EP232_04880 [bacterium]
MLYRYLIFLVFTLILSLSQNAFALDVGAPGEALDRGQVSLSGSIGYAEVEIDKTDVGSASFMFKGVYGVSRVVNPYLKLGTADLRVGDLGFSGGLGLAYGGGVLFRVFAPEESSLSINVDTQVQWRTSKESSRSYDMFEGQVALLGAVKSGGTNGYGGLAFSYVDLEGEGNSLSENSIPHLLFGLDYFLDFNFFFNLEAHLFGENSISLGVGYLF